MIHYTHPNQASIEVTSRTMQRDFQLLRIVLFIKMMMMMMIVISMMMMTMMVVIII
jgi:hypothetical protein